MVSFADSPFKFLLLPPSLFLDQVLHTVRPKRWVSRRNRELLRPLCGMICKCELYCLSKRSRHFIDQQVITFHMFWDLISLHRKNALKYILLYFSKLEFQRMRHTFPVHLQRVFTSFFAETWQECCPIIWQENGVGELLFLVSFESNEYLSKGNGCYIKL